MADIVVDTYKLKLYADRLANVNNRITRLDRRLDGLYFRVGLQGLWNLMQADALTCYSWRLNRCQSYLQQTATDFDVLEKTIDYNQYIINLNRKKLLINNDFELLKNLSPKLSTNFWSKGIKDKFQEYLDIFNSDGDTKDKSNAVIKWMSSIRKDLSTYKDYLEWIGGNELKWPSPLKDGFDFIKALDAGNKLIFGALEYGEGLVNGDLELLTSGSNNLLGALKSGISTAIKTDNAMIDFKGGIFLDYGKNMVSNWIESIQTETKSSEVYWNTFANSAIEVFNDTVCNTPTLVIAYKPAEILSSAVGFDLQGAYENVSDKKGFAAVTDTFSQMNDLFIENSSWENWKSGMSVIADGIAGWFK